MRSTLSKSCRVSLFILLANATSVAADMIQYSTNLSPEAIGATGSGSALITVDTVLNTMRVEANFSGLSGLSTVAHIHCCTTTPGAGLIGVATLTPSFTNWPAGVTTGSYDFTYDTTLAATFNAPFVTGNGGTAAGALAALIAGIEDGRAYFNVHSSAFQSGEIRGFLALVPEPGPALLIGFGLGALARRRRSRD